MGRGKGPGSAAARAFPDGRRVLPAAGRAFPAAALPAAGVALLALLTLLAGCAGKPPAVSRVAAQLTLTRDPETRRITETLGVFLAATDPDGQEDLEAFYVIHDGAELFWKVESGQWVTGSAEGEQWVGTNALTVPDGLPFPGGEYRVVLQDAAGETAEQAFTLPEDRLAAEEMTYPRAEVKSGTIVVSGPYESPEVRVLGPDGRHRMSFAAARGAGPIEISRIAAAIPGLGEEFRFTAWARDAKTGIAVQSGPYGSRGLPRQ
jgi:hypothetical protein